MYERESAYSSPGHNGDLPCCNPTPLAWTVVMHALPPFGTHANAVGLVSSARLAPDATLGLLGQPMQYFCFLRLSQAANRWAAGELVSVRSIDASQLASRQMVEPPHLASTTSASASRAPVSPPVGHVAKLSEGALPMGVVSMCT